jgi:2-keto-4-pentenoate hydratase/2-oxohepta-3-ene-1,7-dioic acid hydratase in catechol pathway
LETSRRQFLIGSSVVAASAALTLQPTIAASDPKPAGLRLVSYVDREGATPRVAVLLPNQRLADVDVPSMAALIAAGPSGLEAARRAAAGAGGPKVTDVHLLAPLAPARNVYAVGWNYLAHFEAGQAVRTDNKTSTYPEHPVFFTKGTHTINDPYGTIPFDPSVSTQIDWEGELAVVIGKRGRNISEADALDHVFGYSVINDTTARDVQQKRHGGQWFKGKSLDGHGPMGPWIVTKDGLDYDNLHLQTRVNGKVMQDASTKQMYFKVPRIIAELSLGLTLEAGDIIATGTPDGTGFTMKPQVFLKPGDVLETEISGIGIIRNTVRAVS